MEYSDSQMPLPVYGFKPIVAKRSQYFIDLLNKAMIIKLFSEDASEAEKTKTEYMTAFNLVKNVFD